MKQIQKRNMQGFTLIELMIVVAIIAILAAIAISQYQDYIIRSQVSEGSALADGVKTAMAEFYQNHGSWPSSNASAGLAQSSSISGSYVSDVNVATTSGMITVAYGGPKANAKIPATSKLQFSAVTHAGSIEWHCLKNNIPQKWVPSSCT